MKDPAKPFKAPPELPSQSPRPGSLPPLRRKITTSPAPIPPEPHRRGNSSGEGEAGNHQQARSVSTPTHLAKAETLHLARHLRLLFQRIIEHICKSSVSAVLPFHLHLSLNSDIQGGYSVQTAHTANGNIALQRVPQPNTLANHVVPLLLQPPSLVEGTASIYITALTVPKVFFDARSEAGAEAAAPFVSSIPSDQGIELVVNSSASLDQTPVLDAVTSLNLADVAFLQGAASTIPPTAVAFRADSAVSVREATQAVTVSPLEADIVISGIQSSTDGDTPADVNANTVSGDPSGETYTATDISASDDTATSDPKSPTIGDFSSGDSTDARDNVQTLDADNGNHVITIVAGQGTVRVQNFTGVGSEPIPKQDILSEIDTLQFDGAGLTVENLVLTQEGNDLKISFLSVADTIVILENFQLEDLDNLTFVPEGWQMPAGNILFNDDATIIDHFDVFKAEEQVGILFNTDTVTFLNDLDNKVIGFESSDTIYGLGGNDTLLGEGGDDWLIGGTGDDLLIGHAGNDVLDGGVGSDTYIGGSGHDQFVVDASLGTDIIKDFTVGEDTLLFSEDIDWRDIDVVYGVMEQTDGSYAPLTALFLPGAAESSPFLIVEGVMLEFHNF